MGSCNLVLHLELVWTKYLCNKFVALAVLGTSMFEWGRLGRLWCCMPLKLPRSMIYLVNAVRSCASEHVWICAYLKCAILLWFYIWFPISIVSFALTGLALCTVTLLVYTVEHFGVSWAEWISWFEGFCFSGSICFLSYWNCCFPLLLQFWFGASYRCHSPHHPRQQACCLVYDRVVLTHLQFITLIWIKLDQCLNLFFNGHDTIGLSATWQDFSLTQNQHEPHQPGMIGLSTQATSQPKV
jgi:hypothetical protein